VAISDKIREATLRELTAAHSPCEVRLVGEAGGFTVALDFGPITKVLTSTRGQVRRFASLNTAAEFLKQLGISRFEVDATQYERGRMRKPRPDRAEALRRTRTTPRQQELLPKLTDGQS
jgi:hypothetical protein